MFEGVWKIKKIILFAAVFSLLIVENVNADTPISYCQPLYGSGTYYLTQDISSGGTCLTISGNYITLDCKGHKITGSGTGSGIDISSGYYYNTVKNCVINNFYYGISTSSNNNLIYNNYFSNNAINAQDSGHNSWNTNKKLACNETNLVGYWRLDEGSGTIAYDSSIYSNDGTLMNGPIWVDGKYGKALSFDGADDYVSVPHNANFNPSSSGFSVGMWVSPKPQAWNHGILDKGNGAAFLIQDESWNTYRTRFVVGGLTPNYVDANFSFDDLVGSFHYLAFIYDPVSSKLLIYHNGTLDSQVSVTGTPSGTDTNILYIGTDMYVSNFYNGTIDEVKIYSRALIPDEIMREYERGTSGKNIAGGPYLGGNYWSNYMGQDTDGDGLGNTPYMIPGGPNTDNLPIMECAFDADCDDNNECTNNQCSSGHCTYPNKLDGSNCSGYPGKCCSGICDNNGMFGDSYHPDCRTGPQCISPGNWGYLATNDESLCGGFNCRECNSGYCNYDDQSRCLGNCDYCSGSCTPTPSSCTGSCVQCTGTGNNFTCTPFDNLCYGNCVYCTGSGTNFNCAPNETVCESNYKCASCVGGGNYFGCNLDPTENDDCNQFDLDEIATCDNDPDNYHPTWDFRNLFDSHCVNFNQCSQGDPNITHTCADNDLGDTVTLGGCDAQCDENIDCLSEICNADCICAQDTTPPIITILSPVNKTYCTTLVPITFTVNEPTSWIGYSLDGTANKTVTGNTSLLLSYGSHNIIVYAKDMAGNEGASTKVTFKVNTPPNSPSKPVGPTTGVTGTSYCYSTSATDPDGESPTGYFWDWGDGWASTSSGTACHTWYNGGIFRVAVRCRDWCSALSGWSTLYVNIAKPSCTCTEWQPTFTCCGSRLRPMEYWTRTCTPSGCDKESKCEGYCFV